MHKIPEIPFELFSEQLDAWHYEPERGTLAARALPKSDFYRNPAGNYEDDANASLNALWLTGVPVDPDFQFSAKIGKVWKLIRAFTLGKDVSNHRIGFLVQAPVGEGCDVEFSEIKYLAQTLNALRDGS